MARKRFTAEQIIMKLREAEVGLARGTSGGTGSQTGVSAPDAKGDHMLDATE